MSNEKEMNSKHKRNEPFVKGLNWGNLKTTENELIFTHKSKLWFDIPMSSISNIQHISNKNEIALEVNQEDINEEESALCELRLFVPEQDVRNKKSKNEENESIIEENKVDENNEVVEEIDDNDDDDTKKKSFRSRAEIIKDDIVRKAKIGSVSNSIAHIQDIQMITPRGKFDLYFTKNYLKIHGISFN